MRTSIFPSLAFLVLTSLSVAAYAAPVIKAAGPLIASEQASAETQLDKVNINTADAPTLQKALLGIGTAKARAIVAYREEFGAFTSIEELLEVKGIGKSILEQNRRRLVTE